MRDWTVTSDKDRECLQAAANESERGAWKPWRGTYGRARRLKRQGLLKEAGIAAMPPHILYVITDYGREELQVAASLTSA